MYNFDVVKDCLTYFEDDFNSLFYNRLMLCWFLSIVQLPLCRYAGLNRFSVGWFAVDVIYALVLYSNSTISIYGSP